MPTVDIAADLLRTLRAEAEEVGWCVEWNRKDTDIDGAGSYDLYLWPTQ